MTSSQLLGRLRRAAWPTGLASAALLTRMSTTPKASPSRHRAAAATSSGCPTSAATATTSPRASKLGCQRVVRAPCVAAVDDDPGAGVEHRGRDRAADPARRAGHERDASIQSDRPEPGRDPQSRPTPGPARTGPLGRSPTLRAAARRSESGHRRRRSPNGPSIEAKDGDVARVGTELELRRHGPVQSDDGRRPRGHPARRRLAARTPTDRR